ncbi:hypothetical protein THAOC_25759, partial [Thalassiosira oceanica]
IATRLPCVLSATAAMKSEQTAMYASSWHGEALTAQHWMELQVASRKEDEQAERHKEDTRGKASLGTSPLQ